MGNPSVPNEFPSSFRARLRVILGIALPIIGGMLSQNVLNLIDVAMVGRLDNAEVALGAAGFGGITSWLFSSFFMGAGPAVQAITAREMGAGRTAPARGALTASLALVGFLVVPYALILSDYTEEILSVVSTDARVVEAGIPYLEARFLAIPFVIANFCFRGYWNGVGRTSIYLQTIVTMHVANVVLNWVLIYGNLGAPALGVYGAGLASALSVALGTAMYVTLNVVHHGKGNPFPRPKNWMESIRRIGRLSIPNGTQNILFSLGFSAFFALAQRLGTPELAATNVLINLNLFCVLPGLGFGLSAATLVGQSLGRNQPDVAEGWAWQTVKISAALLTLLGLFLAGFAETWLTVLVPDPATVALAVTPLVILGLIQPLDSMGVVLSQTLLGAGAVKTVMVWSVALQWGLFLPVAAVVCLYMDGTLETLWMLFAAWRILFAGAMVWCTYQGKWKTAPV